MNNTLKQHKVIAIIQARMSSSRLPGKVLLDLAGQPMLERAIKRALQATQVDKVAVATTTDPSDGS
jgi:spore coat polysaccharide biosynthesis protein SpsF (cytidylyltransferase family)